ncbi:extracellular solute-binding protein [Microbacterium halotolerans]|uniref:extracellular solute-binding protein n=1 Tax=Microbacterium halotolerans TaxID=246613 RepID=UPI000E6AB12C|nr:extracellular solute-binding protein [Microbacterium halotolerans]
MKISQTQTTRARVVRRSALGATALAAALSLAACGGAQPGSGSSSGDLSAWTLTGSQQAVFESSFAEWNEAHPDTPLTSEFFANDAYKEKIRTAVGSGNAPTLIYNWTGGTLADYVDNGDVVDLSGQVDELSERVIPSILQAGQVDGAQYAVPNNSTQPVILYFNKKIFDEVGVEPPTTWEETLDVVGAFQDEGITPFAVAGQSQWPYLMWVAYLTDRIGGPEVFQAIQSNEPDAWSHPAVTEALEKIQELVDAGAFGDSYGSVVADANADLALVHTDQAAMILQGSWVYASFKADAPDWFAEGNLGYTPFPSVAGGEGDPANIVGNPANFWSVSSHASEEAQQAAIEYLNEVNLNEATVDNLLDEGLVPSTTGTDEKIAAHDESEYMTYASEMVREAPSFQLSWDQAIAPAQAQELLTQLSQIFQGTSTPEQFVEAMNATIE